jgi:CheY-like chemotaxis protein
MKKILLASEYILFLKRNTALLMRRGFQLFTTSSGKEALELHREHHFDLIFTDFKLEDMNGCIFCSLIREREDSIDVPIIISCHNFPGSIERVEHSGANAMLLKPIEPIKLMETIGSFLDIQVGRSKRVVLKVKVFSKAGERELEFICLSHDVSSTGILLETDQILEVGSQITCQFTLPNVCQIETEGKVARSMTALACDNLYGVKFIAMSLSNRRAIDSYIASFPMTAATS